ncbi:unnamed protein product, partial [marine sediment metagenome]
GVEIIELGTGNGFTAIELATLGYNVTSIDVSEVALNIARNRTPNIDNKPKFIFGDARELNLPDNHYDAAISSSLVEHFTRDDAIKHLKEVKRILKPGGCYLFYCGNRLYSGYRSGGYHLRMYNTKEQLDLAVGAGFYKVMSYDAKLFEKQLNFNSFYHSILNFYETLFEFMNLDKFLKKGIKAKLLVFILVCAYKEL